MKQITSFYIYIYIYMMYIHIKDFYFTIFLLPFKKILCNKFFVYMWKFFILFFEYLNICNN